MTNLLHSRKFWLLVMDTAISLIVYFVTKYAAPELADDMLKVIGLLQPVVALVIVGITAEDVALKLNRNYEPPATQYTAGWKAGYDEAKDGDQTADGG